MLLLLAWRGGGGGGDDGEPLLLGREAWAMFLVRERQEDKLDICGWWWSFTTVYSFWNYLAQLSVGLPSS